MDLKYLYCLNHIIYFFINVFIHMINNFYHTYFKTFLIMFSPKTNFINIIFSVIIVIINSINILLTNRFLYLELCQVMFVNKLIKLLLSMYFANSFVIWNYYFIINNSNTE